MGDGSIERSKMQYLQTGNGECQAGKDSQHQAEKLYIIVSVVRTEVNPYLFARTAITRTVV